MKNQIMNSALALLLLGCAAEPVEGINGVGLSVGTLSIQPTEDAYVNAYQAVMRAVPAWNDFTVNRQPSTEVDDESIFQEPQQIAHGLSNQEYSLAERKANGREFYFNRDRTEVLKVNRARGSWELLRARDRSAARTMTKEHAVSEAMKIADYLKVPRSQMGELVNDELESRYADGTKKTLARHVRIHRSVNGLRVRSSAMSVTFDLAGKPFRIERTWPAFNLARAATLRTREEAVEAIARRLARRFSEGNLGQVVSDLSYQIGSTGAFEPVVSVSVFAADGFGSPERVEYSLVAGLIDPPASMAGEDA